MKCEKCGKNIANVHYKANYNGSVTEKHLCSQCARSEGLEDNIFGEAMLSDFFGGFLGNDFFRPFGAFGAMPVMMPTMFMPRLEVRYDSPDKTENNEVSQEKDTELAKKREKNELRHQLKAAIKEERFEDAAVLRDKLREIEG